MDVLELEQELKKYCVACCINPNTTPERGVTAGGAIKIRTANTN
jgi:hypothetical protein